MRIPSVALGLGCALIVSSLACGDDGGGSNTSGATDSAGDGDGDGDGDTEGDPLWSLSWQPGEDYGAVMSAWGSTPDEVYVVGGQPGGPGFVARFNGESWNDEDVPEGIGRLNWVYGVDDRVWAVGGGGTILERIDGEWVTETAPDERVLWGIWGASENELWTVGGDAVDDEPAVHRRGVDGSWTPVSVPDLGEDVHGLFKVWGFSADDVWAIGDGGAALHYEGSQWTSHPSGQPADLISLWGSPEEGLVAVGGRANGRIARWTGEGWEVESLATDGLNGVWVDPTGGITAVGVAGLILDIAPGGFEFGTEESETAMVLHGVYGFGDGPRFAVGGSLLAQPPHIGVVLRSEAR